MLLEARQHGLFSTLLQLLQHGWGFCNQTTEKEMALFAGMMDFKCAVERTAFPLTPASTWRCTHCKVQRATQASSCIGNLHKELQVM